MDACRHAGSVRSQTTSEWLICIGQRDLSSNHPSPRTHWRSSIVWPTIPWRVATGQSCGGLAKDCPPNGWRPSPATQPTGCTPSPSITMKTAPQVSAIGIIATPVALDSSQARRIRPWQACSTSRHPIGGVGRGRRSPPRWPPRSAPRAPAAGLGRPPTTRLAPQMPRLRHAKAAPAAQAAVQKSFPASCSANGIPTPAM
jgi:hypothetical protein